MARAHKSFHFGLKLPMAAAAAALVLSGCASGAGSDTGSGARDTGTYPNLNIKPGVAAAQFTPEEQAAVTARLNSDRAQAAANTAGTPPNDVAELSQLGSTHAQKTLDEIEQKKKKKPAN